MLMRDQIPPIFENPREQGYEAQKLRLLLVLRAGPIAAEGDMTDTGAGRLIVAAVEHWQVPGSGGAGKRFKSRSALFEGSRRGRLMQ